MRVTLVAALMAIVVVWGALGGGNAGPTALAQAPSGGSDETVKTVPLAALTPPATPLGRPVGPASPAMPPTPSAQGSSAQASAATAGGITTLATSLADGRQVLTVIDGQTRAIAVYHVDLASGSITLKGVRQISWDLQLTDFNSGHPLPGEVRAMFPPR
ncbi:MAG: hypothetical protein K1X74_04395 [Pirellulales bacterium]|nr:hypothetical protein [Pirellulales bacterium]